MARQRPQFDRLSGKRFNHPCCLQLSGARLSATLTLLIFGCSTFFRATVRSVVSPVSFRRFLFTPLLFHSIRFSFRTSSVRPCAKQQRWDRRIRMCSIIISGRILFKRGLLFWELVHVPYLPFLDAYVVEILFQCVLKNEELQDGWTVFSVITFIPNNLEIGKILFLY